MFDTHIHRRDEHHHHHREVVHEHRAPTDASVKLLMEMEEKALEKILASVRLEGCENWCVVHHMRDSMLDMHCFIIEYLLAGQKKRTMQVRIDPYQLMRGDPVEVMCAELVKALSEDIARQLLAPAMQKSFANMIGIR